jgi:hypothetical protein
MKEQTLLEAAAKILSEAKDPKAKLFGLYAKNDGKYSLYAFDTFVPTDKNDISNEDYKTLWAQAQKNGASRGYDWHDSPTNRQINLKTIKEEIAEYKELIAEKTALVKALEKQLKAVQ